MFFQVFVGFFVVVCGVAAEPGNSKHHGHHRRCNDPNAVFKQNPNPCPATCAFPGAAPCDNPPISEGCECKKGFYLNDRKKCVELQDCPEAKKCCANETFVFCNVGCPTNDCPKDDNRGIIACSPPYPCRSGCACRKDYLRNSEGRCVRYSDCPPIKCRRKNEMYSARPPPCLFDRCSDIGKENVCHVTHPNRPQCICKPGYYRNDEDVCVCKEQCPKPAPKCGVNEIPKKCKTICPPQRCDVMYTDFFCFDTPECVPGCDCLPGYLRDDDDICIPSDQCLPPPEIPFCDENEKLSDCAIECPPQTCASRYTLYRCAENIPCKWGCDCVQGYLRNADGKCVPSKLCDDPEPCGYNEVYSKCAIECPPQTCESIFTSYFCSNETKCKAGCNCIDGHLRNRNGTCVPSDECFPACDIAPESRPTCANPSPDCFEPPISMENVDGCKCKAGYILSDTYGPCIRIEECPDTGCNGDPNSVVTACPWPCPSTCNAPDAGAYGNICEGAGCQCKPGFILEEWSGKCILPEKCEDYPCEENSTFSDCAFDCPNQHCPIDDDLTEVACKPGRPCPSGCVCKPGYLKTSYDDDYKCVLAKDCPPVTCTRLHEIWCSCASECLAEKCSDLVSKPECYPDPLNCKPKCVCCKGYYRNESGICVPEKECPKPCNVQQECRPTCAVPNPPNCPYIPPSETNDDKCNCQSGYVLSEAGGRCIKVEECQAGSCNSDPHATIKVCPQPCPSTCSIPNANQLCKRKCDPIGCECNPGYLQNDNGTCILPEECPAKPCNVQQECRPTCAVPNPPNCPYIPPSETNDDKCNCQSGYVLSKAGGRCIKVEECQAGSCNSDPYATIKVCPQPCPSTCSIPNAYLVCKRKCDPIGCECNSGYLKGDNGTCILPEECPGGNPCGENEVFSSCLYQCQTNFCPTDDSRDTSVCEFYPFAPCISGCMCQLNHKRYSVENPKCIVSSDCPPINCTRQHEKWNSCPSECQSENCDAVDDKPTVCNTLVLNCNPSCRCKKGYFRRGDDLCVCSEECRRLNRQKSPYLGEE